MEKRRPEITSELCPQATHGHPTVMSLRVIDDSHMTTLSQEIKMADCRAAVRTILLVGCFCLSSAIFSSNDNQERKVRHSKYVLKLTEGFFFSVNYIRIERNPLMQYKILACGILSVSSLYKINYYVVLAVTVLEPCQWQVIRGCFLFCLLGRFQNRNILC